MSLAALLDLGERELVALVGGGGKSTMLFGLGHELAGPGKHVLLTTTTKMGRNQTSSVSNVCWSANPEDVNASLRLPGPVMVVTGGDDHKITGPPPELVGGWFSEHVAGYVIVEADGSNGKPLKAPAAHEPVIPVNATLVVILIGIDAVGLPLAEAVHRVEVAQRFTGLQPHHRMTPKDCADVLLHPEGALRSCPEGARVIIGITKVATEAQLESANQLAAILKERRPDIPPVIVPPGRPKPNLRI